MVIIRYVNPICVYHYKISKSGPLLGYFTNDAFKYLSSFETSLIDDFDPELTPLPIMELIREFLN